MARRVFKVLAVIVSAGAVCAWAYTGWMRFLRYGDCYDIQGDPPTVRACAAYTADIVAGDTVAFATSAVAIPLVVIVLCWRSPAKDIDVRR